MTQNDIRSQIGGRRVLLSCTIELLTNCNFACKHCYQGGANTTLIDVPTYQNLLNELAAEETLRIALTGGEILLHPEFPTLYQMTISDGFVVSVATNLSLLNNEIIKLWQQHPPIGVFVSLYGWRESTYEAFTGRRGMRDRVYHNIEKLLDAGISVTMQAQLTTITAQDLEEIHRFAQEHNIPFRYDCLIMPRLDANMEPVQLALTPDAVLRFIRTIPTYQNASTEVSAGEAIRVSSLRKNVGFGCSAGIRSAYITSDLRLRACMFVSALEEDLNKNSITEAWKNMGNRLQGLVPTDSPCLQCKHLPYCVWCPGKSFAFHGTFGSPIEYLCEFCSLASDEVPLPTQF